MEGLAFPRLIVVVGRSHNDIYAPDIHSITEMSVQRLILSQNYSDRRILLYCKLERHASFRKLLREGNCHRGLGIKLKVAEPVGLLVVYVCVGPRHDILHELVRPETIDLVGHVYLVDEVVITVQACRISLAFRVLDRDRSSPEIGKLSRRIPRICSQNS